MLNFDPRQWLADNCPEDKGPTVATVATVTVARCKIEKSGQAACGAEWQENGAIAASPK